MTQIQFKKLQPQAIIPQRQTLHSAGYDLHSLESLVLDPGSRAIISTGISIRIPLNTVGMVCSRSGLAAKHGVFVVNSPGIIDADYTGELKVILGNLGNDWFPINVGDRIAQLIINPVLHSQLPESDRFRGDGGFGSTGLNIS